jgi:exodeoxyribonuclease-3
MTKKFQSAQKSDDLFLACGDFNVGHRELDIKNWKGNLTKAGFLPEERAYFDKWFDKVGVVDLGRKHAGEVEGPYTWWSWRGQAFDNNAGWRIDYHIASPELAKTSTAAFVDRAPSYDTRWSDHAPVVATYDI